MLRDMTHRPTQPIVFKDVLHIAKEILTSQVDIKYGVIM